MEGVLSRVLAEAACLAERGEPGSVAWMVNVRGSGPQVVGARLCLAEGARFVGTVGGGAIEAAVLRDAARVRDEGGPMLCEHRLAAELGMCCGGTMELFIEPVRSRDAEVWRALARAEEDGGAFALFLDGAKDGDLGGKVILSRDGHVVASTRPATSRETLLLAEVASGAAKALALDPRTSAPHTAEVAGSLPGSRARVYVEAFEGSRRLVIFGGGHVAKPLARLAKMLGYRVVVVDERADWASAQRFPEADELVHEPYVDFLFRFEPRPSDTLIIVTRGHEFDQEVLRGLVDKPNRYLGMIGSRAKVKRAFLRLEGEGVPSALIGRVHAPIGLNVGAQTPEEIAIAIAAELVAERRGHPSPPGSSWWRDSG
jgi:xanthine dehydrogenase accessory factor